MQFAAPDAANATKIQSVPEESRWDTAWKHIKWGWGKFIEGLDYTFSGRIIMGVVQWIVRFNGYAAEGSMLLAVLWISACSVAPTLVELTMPEAVMNNSVSFCLTVLSLIPEIMLINAIINVIKHWLGVRWQCSTSNFINLAWSLLFTVPTIIFFVLTAKTLLSITASHGTVVQASANLLGWRCLSGWVYGLLDGVYAGVKKMIAKRFQNDLDKEDLQQENNELTQQVQALQEQIAALQMAKPARASAPARKRQVVIPETPAVQEATSESIAEPVKEEGPAPIVEATTVVEQDQDTQDNQGNGDVEEVHTDTELTAVDPDKVVSIKGPAIRKLWETHPDWDVKQIAKAASCSQRTAFRWMPESSKKSKEKIAVNN